MAHLILKVLFDLVSMPIDPQRTNFGIVSQYNLNHKTWQVVQSQLQQALMPRWPPTPATSGSCAPPTLESFAAQRRSTSWRRGLPFGVVGGFRVLGLN